MMLRLFVIQMCSHLSGLNSICQSFSHFAHNFVSASGEDAKFLYQRVPGCNGIADLSLEVVFWTHKFAVGLNCS